MAFLRKKVVKGNEYWYLVENQREGKGVKQTILHYFGKDKPTPEEVERVIKEVKGG